MWAAKNTIVVISCAYDFDRKRKYFHNTFIIADLKISFMLVATSLDLTV